MSDEAWNDWLAAQTDEQQPILETLRTLIMSCGKDIVEEFKWSRPCYSNAGGLFCYLHTTKNHATLGFHRGTSLDDPKGLLEGTGKDMRHVKIRTAQDVDKTAFRKLLKQACSIG